MVAAAAFIALINNQELAVLLPCVREWNSSFIKGNPVASKSGTIPLKLLSDPAAKQQQLMALKLFHGGGCK